MAFSRPRIDDKLRRMLRARAELENKTMRQISKELADELEITFKKKNEKKQDFKIKF